MEHNTQGSGTRTRNPEVSWAVVRALAPDPPAGTA